jgi:hypothetical protein
MKSILVRRKALDVHSDEIPVRILPGQSHGVFPLAASQFQYQRPVVPEEIPFPVSFQRMVPVEYFLERGLDHKINGFQFPEPFQFVLAHPLRGLILSMRIPTSFTGSPFFRMACSR